MANLAGRKEFVWTFASSTFIQILTLASGALTARILGPEGRGQFAASQVWPAIFATIFLLGFNNSLGIAAANSPKDSNNKLEKLAILIGLIVGITGFLFSWWLIPFLLPDDPTVVSLSLLYSLYIPVFVITSNLMAIDQGSGNFKQFNTTRNILTPVYIFLIALIAFFGVHEVQWFIISLLVANMAVLLYRLTKSRLTKLNAYKNNKHTDLKHLVRVGVPFWVSNCVLIIRENAERLLLLALLGTGPLGLYVVASVAASAHLTITKTMNLLIFSRSAGLPKPLAMKDAAHLFRLMSVINVVASAFMIGLQPLLIPAIFGKAFAGAVVPASLLVIAQFFQAQGSVLHEALRGQSRPLLGLTGALVGMLIFVVLGFALVPSSGLAGVAVASIIGQAGYCAFMMSVISRLDPTGNLIITKADLKQLVILAGGVKGAFVRTLTPSNVR